MDYIFTVRRTSKGAFTAEPGRTHFLEVPESATDISPDQAISRGSKKIPDSWARKIMVEARSGKNPVTGQPRGDIVIYVHGFNTPTKVMLERHRKLQAGLKKHGFEGCVISFDWPSASMALNYLEDRSDAKSTARYLVDVGIAGFADRQTQECEINLHIIAHSMGAFVVREAFDDADDRPGIAAKSWSVSQVLLLSGDVSAGSLEAGNPKSSSLYRHCVRLTNYHNPFDGALSLSNVKRVGVAPRAGRVGIRSPEPSNAVNVDCGPHFKARKASFEDIPNASHTWYFFDDTFMKDAAATIQGDVDRKMIETRRVEGDKLYL